MSRKYEDFSHRLNQLMGKKNISPSELCAKADISKQSLSQYICGSRLPQAQALISLSDALEVSIDFLLTGKEKGNIINSDGLTKEQIDYLTESAKTFRKYNDIMSKRNNPLPQEILRFIDQYTKYVNENVSMPIFLSSDKKDDFIYCRPLKILDNNDIGLRSEDDSLPD